jgi:hypothetical protein
MIDPGRPFSVPFADVIASIQGRVRDGVDQPAQQSFIFKSTVSSYELPPAATDITRVTGMAQSQFRVFAAGSDYTFSGSRLVWINSGAQPDDGSRLDVEYTYREARSGITDFNEGSVAGTFIRAVSREIKLLYEQMDEAYRRGFIDQAAGVALDAIVALVGVTRKPATAATGTVTFFRKTAPPRTIAIPKGTRVADQAGRTFVTAVDASLPPAAPIDEFATQAGGVVKTQQRIAEVVGVWKAADDPAKVTPFPIKPGFGSDGLSITLDLPAAGLPAGLLRIRYKPLAATVAIQAAQPGPDGNVNAGTITIMPTPPSGIDGVTNDGPTQDGQDAETDDRLRDRAKHALERAGNATLDAIKFAVLEVDGVEGAEVIDRSSDDSIPLGEVRVRYSGGHVEDVRAAVERTRAAGILARLESIVQVMVSGTFYLIPAGTTPPPPASIASFLSAAGDAMQALAIGAPLALRRLNSLVFNLAGLADVAEAQLEFSKPDPAHPGSFIQGDVSDPFLIAPTEVVRPAPDSLKAVVLSALKNPASHKTADKTFTLDIQLTDGPGNAITFRSLNLNLNVVIRASSLNNPDQPPERIANFTRAVQFTASATAPLNIAPTDLAGFRPLDHKPDVEFVLTAAAYPGLAGVNSTVNIS